MHALSSSLGNDQEMTKENVELGFLGKDCKFRKLSAAEIENYLQNVETKKPSRMVAQVIFTFEISYFSLKYWAQYWKMRTDLSFEGILLLRSVPENIFYVKNSQNYERFPAAMAILFSWNI